MASKPIDIELVTSDRVQERFWAKVDKSAGPDGCWVWRGAAKPNGYGKFSIGKAKTSRWYYPHRISYAIHFRTDPGEMFCCHKCDNPICCNPMHIFLGTDRENKNDMIGKRRQGAARGENSPKARFTAAEVASIRSRYADGSATCLGIAVEYGVDETTIRSMVRGETYRTAGGPICPNLRLMGRGSLITPDDVRRIRHLKFMGVAHRLIAEDIGCPKHVVDDVSSGKSWSHVK